MYKGKGKGKTRESEASKSAAGPSTRNTLSGDVFQFGSHRAEEPSPTPKADNQSEKAPEQSSVKSERMESASSRSSSLHRSQGWQEKPQ